MNEFCAKLKQENATEYQNMAAALQEEVATTAGNGGPPPSAATDSTVVEELAIHLMDRDVKSAALKDLQGKMWQAGYASGELKGHVYPDFVPTLDWLEKCHDNVKVCIYSSGSIQAQKLLFGNSVAGDLLPKLSAHFDIPTAGPKKVDASYKKIAAALNVDVSDIVFVSDAVAELEAATAAGIGCAVMSIRPGNVPLSASDKKKYPSIYSLMQLCGE